MAKSEDHADEVSVRDQTRTGAVEKEGGNEAGTHSPLVRDIIGTEESILEDTDEDRTNARREYSALILRCTLCLLIFDPASP